MTGLAVGSMCSGYGGLELGVRLALGAAATVVWHAEHDPDDPRPTACQAAPRVLAHHWPAVPNLGDLAAVNWQRVLLPDLVTAGFPCTDISGAGPRVGLGAATRSGVWAHVAAGLAVLRARAVAAGRPGPLLYAENVEGLLHTPARRNADAGELEPCPWCLGDHPDAVLRALGAVLGDLAGLGFDAEWCVLPAAAVGACHQRNRVFVLAWPVGERPTAVRAVQPGVQHHRAVSQLFRTPTAQLAINGGSQHPDKRRAGGHGPTLADEVEHLWGTPGWARYQAAIAHHELVSGHPVPAPVEQGRNGQPRLTVPFVEWMMLLPPGHVTAVPGLTRNEQLRALGNGVVPAQAAAALTHLLARTP